MANLSDGQTALLTRDLEQVLRNQPGDVESICKIGKALSEGGRAPEARRCYQAAVEGLRRHARAGNVTPALFSEQIIYETFVSPVDEEQHYYRSFADWKGALAKLGRKFRQPAAASRGGTPRVGFFLHNGHILGHTEVLLKTLSLRPRGGQDPESRIYLVWEHTPEFAARCRELGVEIVSARDALGKDSSAEERLLWLRERFKQDGTDICVWVSAPVMAAFALSMRLAPVQIFWALRFHPLAEPYIDGYISWGAPGEETRRYGSQEWSVVPMPLAIEDARPDPAAVQGIRNRFPEEVLVGTLARESKINSPAYLRAVAQVLAANPRAGFLWTGRAAHPGIETFFREAGVADRCHFVGWVDTRLYAAALDVFLETFPFGSGITSLHALGAGTPLLSFLHDESIFRTYFRDEVLDAPDRHAILCARDEKEYAELAGRLISDPEWRKQIGERGRAFFLQELQNSSLYVERFYATVSRIAEATKRTSSSVR